MRRMRRRRVVRRSLRWGGAWVWGLAILFTLVFGGLLCRALVLAR